MDEFSEVSESWSKPYTVSGGIWNPNPPDPEERGAPLGTYVMVNDYEMMPGKKGRITTYYHLYANGEVEARSDYERIEQGKTLDDLRKTLEEKSLIGTGALVQTKSDLTGEDIFSLKITPKITPLPQTPPASKA